MLISSKDQIGKMDRVNIPPVKLQIDETKNVPSVHINKPFNVAYHLRRPARREFREMVDAGIVVPNNEPSAWCSQAFPRMKPGSDPPRCRWVTALQRPVWGAESSSQVMRHIDPEARFFACFDATRGFHQIEVDEESSKLMSIVTQYGTYHYTVLGQGICSSQDH